MASLEFLHLNVFCDEPFGGNGLPVFPSSQGLTVKQMLTITQELRQFESVFLAPGSSGRHFSARIFDLFEELPFAGHPLLGAAVALHALADETDAATWHFSLPVKQVDVDVTPLGHGRFVATLDQGKPEFGSIVMDLEALAKALSLSTEDIHPDFPPQVISTGLKYLVVPVLTEVLHRTRHACNLTSFFQDLGAQFVVVLDVQNLEIRHWNNDGIIEDIATGSAAGTIAAYFLTYGAMSPGETITLSQGRFVGRPSRLTISGETDGSTVSRVRVGGGVCLVGRGALDQLPEVH